MDVIKEGQFFGEVSFFTGTQKIGYAVAQTYTSIYKIDRQAFIEIVRENQDDYESFCLLRDKLQLSGRYDMLDLKCQSCYDQSHRIESCPRLHLNINLSLY